MLRNSFSKTKNQKFRFARTIKSHLSSQTRMDIPINEKKCERRSLGNAEPKTGLQTIWYCSVYTFLSPVSNLLWVFHTAHTFKISSSLLFFSHVLPSQFHIPSLLNNSADFKHIYITNSGPHTFHSPFISPFLYCPCPSVLLSQKPLASSCCSFPWNSSSFHFHVIPHHSYFWHLHKVLVCV